MSSLENNKNTKILKKIKWMCHDLYITSDNQVFNLSFESVKERVKGGSYGYQCGGKFRTKKWIRENCVNMEGFIGW